MSKTVNNNIEISNSNEAIKNDLFNNIERSIYTFNLGNINEICFNKVFNSSSNIKFKTKPLERDYVLYDNCLDKYFETFEIVKNSIKKIIKEICDEYLIEIIFKE